MDTLPDEADTQPVKMPAVYVYIVTRSEWGWESSEDKVIAVFSSIELARQYINAELEPYENRSSYEVHQSDDYASVSSTRSRSIGGVADWNVRFEIVPMPVMDSVPTRPN